MKRYSRNFLYVSDEAQQQIKHIELLVAGCGLGSNIAECALRFGFESITLVDGDVVELSNLNRQNYLQEDIGMFKVDALKRRLTAINADAKIDTFNEFINSKNIEQFIHKKTIAINALDFSSDVPFLFDRYCQKENIPVLHPYNFGWGTLVFVIMPTGANISILSAEAPGLEKVVASFLINHLEGSAKKWVQKVLTDFIKQDCNTFPPQLAIGSWLTGGICTNILYRLSMGLQVRQFPDFYFSTIENE